MKKYWYFAMALAIGFTSCKKDKEEDDSTSLNVPSEYVSDDYATNSATESAVISELSTMVGAANTAEGELANNAGHTITSIEYPSNLAGVTLASYKTKVDTWLAEIVKAVNDDDNFQNPGLNGSPADGEEGGLLGLRLLDENGLELEQMIDKGLYGAACYNHAISVINGDLSSSASIDKLVNIFGTSPEFAADAAGKAAKYAKRRSDNTAETGFFYDIKKNLITAKAAIEAGSEYNDDRDAALNEFLLNWEKSNFATVINYCNGTRTLLAEAQNLTGDAKDEKLGDAMHAYAEGVGFAHGFLGLSEKLITDAEINEILDLLLTSSGETPESYRFLNEAALIQNLNDIEDKIQAIYGFTDAEVTSFYTNN